jgi:hypothetical protein
VTPANDWGDEAAPAPAEDWGDAKVEQPPAAPVDRNQSIDDGTLPTQSDPGPQYSSIATARNTPWSLPQHDVATDKGESTDEAAFNAWRVGQAKLSPLAANNAWDLAQRRGLDPSFVAEHLAEIGQTQQEEDHAAQLAANPGLAQQFKDPVKASVIKDDMANAAWWERLVTGRSRFVVDADTGAVKSEYTAPGIIRAIERGADVEQPYLSAKAMLGKADDDDMARLRQLEAEPGDFGAANGIESTLYSAAEAIPFIGATAGAAAIATFAGAPVAVVGGVGAATAGVLTFAQSLGPTWRRIKQAAPDADDDTAIGLAVGASAVGGAVAAFLGPEAFEAVPFFGNFLSTTAGEGVARVLADKTVGQSVIAAGKAYGGHWLAGVGMMTAQAAGNSLAVQTARAQSGEAFDGMQVVQDSWTAAKDAAAVMAVLGAWGPGAEFVRDRGRIARIKEDGARFDSLANSVKESTVPNAQIERVIAELRQSGVPAPSSLDDGRTVFVSRAAFEALAQSEKVSPERLAGAVLGDGGAMYQQALLSNSALPVPIEKYAANMIRNGLHDRLRDDVKFSPDGFTNREAQAHKVLLEAFAAKSAPEAAEVAAVRERELHKALAVGLPLGQARAHADMMQAIVLTHARRTGLSPEQAYQVLRPPEIFGPRGRGEPLENVPAPLSLPGAPPAPPVEHFAQTLEREKASPKANPFIQISEPATLEGARAALDGAGTKYALGPDEMREKAEERAKSGAYGKDLEGAKALEPTDPSRGAETTIATPQIANERARYRLHEADALVQSHNPTTFDKNPEYPEGVQERDYFGDKAEQLKVGTGASAFDPRHVLTDELTPTGGPPIVTEGDRPLVLGGNGRTMMLKRAFEDPAVVEKYREALKAKAAQFGLDPAQIDKMRAPVLVREALGLAAHSQIDVLHEAGRRYNDSLTQSLAARTENISEAKALKPSSLAALATLDAGKGNTQAAIGILRADGVVTDRNIAEWVRDDALTKEAKAKIGQMLAARVMDTPERYAQTAPAVVAKIEKIAPALARVAGTNPAFDETPRVQAGLDLLNEAKRAGKTIDQLVGDRQTSLLEKRAPVDPAVLAMAHILEGRGQRDLAAAFEKWADYAAKDPSQGDMFSRPPTLEGARSILRQPSLDMDGSVQRLEQPHLYWGHPGSEQIVPKLKGLFHTPWLRPTDTIPVVDAGSGPARTDATVNDHSAFKLSLNSDARRGLGKSEEGRRAATMLPELMKNALLVLGRPNADQNVKGDFDLYAPLSIDGVLHRVKFSVRLTGDRDGTVRGVQVTRLGETPGVAHGDSTLEGGAQSGEVQATPQARPGTETLGALLAGVKDPEGNALPVSNENFIPVSLDSKGKPVLPHRVKPDTSFVDDVNLEQPAFHGTPHDVDKFKLERIGTGEGAQVYGHGLYFAQNPKVADWYREKLSNAAPEVKIKGLDAASFTNGDGGHSVDEQAAAGHVANLLRSRWTPADAIEQVRSEFAQSVFDAKRTISDTKEEIEREQKGKNRKALIAQWEQEQMRAEQELPDHEATLAAVEKFKPEDFEVQHNGGRLYQVDVPESDRLLDYDKPISEQSQGVKDALKKFNIAPDSTLTGREAYSMIGRLDDRGLPTGAGNPARASAALREAGIPGLQFLDAGSRQARAGDHNFVIWDESEIADLRRLKQEGDDEAQARGHLSIISGPKGKKYEIHLGPGADASTLAHETGHWLVDTLADAAAQPGADPELVRDHAALLKWAGYADPSDREKGLNVPAEEKISHAWEIYLAEGKSPTKALESVFGRFAKWMAKIYTSAKSIGSSYEQRYGQPLDMNEQVRGIFDRLLASSDDIEQDKAANEPSAADAGAGGAGGAAPPGGGGSSGAGAGDSGGQGGGRGRKPVPEVSRAYARSVLNGQPLNSISDSFYRDAERKNARDAIDLAADGKLEESRKADAARSYAAALHDAAKGVLEIAESHFEKLQHIADPESLTRIAKSAANEAGREYIDVLLSVLETVGAREPSSPDAASNRLGVTELLSRLDFDGRDANFDPEHLRQLLATPRRWSALTPLEADNVTQAALQIRAAANAANKVMVGTRTAERRATIAQIAEQSARRPDQGLEPLTRSANEGLVTRALKATGLYNADNLKPEEIWKRLGPEALQLWETTIGARNSAAKMKGEVLRNFVEKFEPILTNGKFGELLRHELSPDTVRELNTANGVMLDPTKVNVETLFMAFLNLGTKSSEERLLGGYQWDKSMLLKAIGREVPKPLLDMGQEVLRYSDEKMWPLISAHAERLNGAAPPKLEKQSIIIRHADGSATSYDGGYFAAKYNADASEFARQRVTADSVESLDRGARATVAASFTKARAARYKDVIDLNWSNYPNHINSVLHYLAYDEPVRSVGAVLRDREFREVATRRIGNAQLKQLDESVKTIARGQAQEAAGAQGFTSQLISGVLRSRGISNAIGFSFGVAAQQVPSHTAYAVTAGKISAKNGTMALGRAVLPENWNQALAKSAELQYRGDHYAERFREALSGHVDVTKGWKQKADVASFAMMDGADRMLSHVLWDAAYRDALEGRKLFDGSIAGNDAAAVEHADRTLRELMPTHNRLEMAASVRNPGALGALQLFRGLKNVVWNVESGLFDQAKVEAKGSPLTAAAGRYGLAAARILGSAAVLHMLGKFWGGHGKNDDDGEGLQGWATWAERSAAASLVSLNAPWGGEIAEGIADHLAHGEQLSAALLHGALELRPAPAMAILADSVKRLGRMVDSDLEPSERIGAATQLLLSNLGGYANQAGKTFGYIRDVANGDQRPRGLGDVLGGLAYGSPGSKNTKNPLTAAQDVVSGE